MKITAGMSYGEEHLLSYAKFPTSVNQSCQQIQNKTYLSINAKDTSLSNISIR